MTQPVTNEAPKEASSTVIAQQSAMLNALPFSDTADFDDASRGFLGTLENARIANAQGRVVWTLEPYGFLSDEKAPATVNPSLWRQSRLNMKHGLFEVVPGVYQVRGLEHRQHDADRGRAWRHCGGHADLDRGCARCDGALLRPS